MIEELTVTEKSEIERLNQILLRKERLRNNLHNRLLKEKNILYTEFFKTIDPLFSFYNNYIYYRNVNIGTVYENSPLEINFYTFKSNQKMIFDAISKLMGVDLTDVHEKRILLVRRYTSAINRIDTTNVRQEIDSIKKKESRDKNKKLIFLGATYIFNSYIRYKTSPGFRAKSYNSIPFNKMKIIEKVESMEISKGKKYPYEEKEKKVIRYKVDFTDPWDPNKVRSANISRQTLLNYISQGQPDKYTARMFKLEIVME